MDNEKLLIFPKLDSKMIYLGIFIACSLFRRLIPTIIEETFPGAELKENKNVKINSYFDVLCNFTGDILAGIFVVINSFLKKEDNNKITTHEGELTKKNMRRKFFLYLPLIAFIDIIAQLCLFNQAYLHSAPNEKPPIKQEDLYFVVMIDILSRYVFSRFILKSYFYKHHILSIILTIIGFIPLTIFNIMDIFFKKNEYSKGTISIFLTLYIVMTIIYSLEDVLNKICLNQLLIRPYELMFYKAVFQIFVIIPLTIFMLVNYSNEFSDHMNSINFVGRFLYRFSFIISNCFRTWSLITIIELVNPNHLSVLKSSEFAVLFVFLSIYSAIKKEDKEVDSYIYYLGTFCCVISLIAAAIHNEMVIINKCGLLKCTNYYKIEVKSNSNININYDENDEDQINKTQDSLINDSSQEY
jgi:hypothetical protein